MCLFVHEALVEQSSIGFCNSILGEGTVKVTADNFKSLLMGPGDETDFNRMLNNATIIVDGVIVAN